MRAYEIFFVSNKVVADGAISGILDKPVGTRVSRYSSGVICSILFLPFMQEHVKRRNTCCSALNGQLVIPGYFDVILGRVRRLNANVILL